MDAPKRFPATLKTTDGRTWSRESSHPKGPEIAIEYVRYTSDDGQSAYSQDGRALRAIRFVDVDEVTVCQPGGKMLEIV